MNKRLLLAVFLVAGCDTAPRPIDPVDLPAEATPEVEPELDELEAELEAEASDTPELLPPLHDASPSWLRVLPRTCYDLPSNGIPKGAALWRVLRLRRLRSPRSGGAEPHEDECAIPVRSD